MTKIILVGVLSRQMLPVDKMVDNCIIAFTILCENGGPGCGTNIARVVQLTTF